MIIETARRVTAEYMFNDFVTDFKDFLSGNENALFERNVYQFNNWHPETDANQRQMILEKMKEQGLYENKIYDEQKDIWSVYISILMKDGQSVSRNKDLGVAESLCYGKAIEKLKK